MTHATSLRRVTINGLHPAMTGHLQAVTQDAERLRKGWAPDGVLEFPYATADMTSRIEGVDRLVAYFGGSRRWRDWTCEEATPSMTRPGGCTWPRSCLGPLDRDRRALRAGLRDLDGAGPGGPNQSWREAWDKDRV